MYDNLARRAISAALANDWAEARQVNLDILDENPEDKDALNRLARAYMQLGDYKNAVNCADKVLALDPLNNIASRCAAKCNVLAGKGVLKNGSVSIDNTFLEIPGKTKIVSLINLCDFGILARLDAGSEVVMIPRQHKVTIVTHEETYIGRLPDDIAMRIIYLVKNGNEYSTHIKSITDSGVKIFIRELNRSPSISHIPSFPIRR